jgi:hypothetical protein
LDLVAALVIKSLVRPVEQPTAGVVGEPRFELLQTVRDVALERLEASGDGDEIRRRHAEWFLHLALQAQASVGGGGQEAWLGRIEAEHDNLRALLRWAIDAGDPLAATMVGMLWRFWYARGYLSEGRRWLDAIAARAEALPDAVRARLLLGLGAIAQAQGDTTRGAAGAGAEPGPVPEGRGWWGHGHVAEFPWAGGVRRRRGGAGRRPPRGGAGHRQGGRRPLADRLLAEPPGDRA